jgi:hypothetical protein
MAGAESAVVGVLARLIGAGAPFGAVSLIIAGGVGLTPARAAITAGACVALAIAGALAACLGATARVWRASVSEGRRSAQREHKPLWQRLYVDVAALALSGLMYWLTASTGFSAALNPDSNPTLSLSVYMFFAPAPALVWLGATLLHLRLRGRAVALPGVQGTTPVDHSYAYVGPDLQDTYGIDPNTITHATTLRDSYFLGAGAQPTRDRLRARRDGILVSKETMAARATKEKSAWSRGSAAIVPQEEHASRLADSRIIVRLRLSRPPQRGSSPMSQHYARYPEPRLRTVEDWLREKGWETSARSPSSATR